MSKKKTSVPSSHQVTLQKINAIGKEMQDFNLKATEAVNYQNGMIQVLQLVIDKMLEENVEVKDFVDFDEDKFREEYGFLFRNYFMHTETGTIIKVVFPEVEEEEEEFEDELLDDSK